MNTNKHFLNIDRGGPRIPKQGIIITILITGLAGLILLHTWSRSHNIVSPIEILLGTAQSPSDELIEIRQGDVTVYMPPNATRQEGTIFIVPVEPNPVMAEDGWTRATEVNIEFRRPDGTLVPDIVFLYPLEICFTLTEEQWQALSQDPRLFQVQTYAENKNPPRWEVLPYTTYPERLQLCGKTYNLSVFGLALRPGVPVTGGTVLSSPGAVIGGTAVPPVPTRERRRVERPTQAAPLSIPTNPPPTQPPPTNPPIQPPPTDPPPAQPPVLPEPVNEEQEEREQEREQEQEEREQEREQEQEEREQEREQEQEEREQEREQEREEREQEKKKDKP